MISEKNAISVRNLSFSYNDGEPVIFEDLSFDIPAGKITYITGPSGCGKSTLLNILTKISDNEIYYFGKKLNQCRQCELNSYFSIVYQNPQTQIFTSTVYDEVSFGPYNMGMDEINIYAIADKVLAKTGLIQYKDISPELLSGGQKQLLVIACALAMETPVIFLDEPMAWLDKNSSDRIMEMLVELKNEGKTIVIIDHDEKRISQSDNLIKLNMSSSRKNNLYENFEESGYESSIADKIPEMLELNRKFLLKTVNSQIYFPESGFKMENLNIELQGGVITSLSGPCGSGKTTFGKILCGLLSPDKGEVYINDKKISEMSLGEIGGYIGYLFQEPGRQIFASVVLEDLIFPGEINGENIIDAKNKAIEILKLLCLYEKAEKSTYTLSVGEKQRLAISGMLMQNFSFLILDEPTTGLDSYAKKQVKSILNFLKLKFGIGMLIISHDIEFCEEISDKKVILDGGRSLL